MNIFSGFKDLLGQINKIDGSIYLKGKDFADIYAKNIALEEEIAARTKELEQANQTILTLNSVWDMMNSPQPLSSMLGKIVSILHEEMGYNFAGILALNTDNKEEQYFTVKAACSNPSVQKAMSILKQSLETYKVPLLENSILAKSIDERKIYSTPDMRGVMRMFYPSITEAELDEVMALIH